MINEYKYSVSIIIPHYNTPKLLQTLLTSIPKHADFQVIVVDDNSNKENDVLDNVIRNDGRCEFYKNDTGQKSAGAARNVGLERASGKWVMFADADDYFIDGFDKIIEKYFDAEEDIVFFAPTSVYLGTDKVADRHIHYIKLIENWQTDIPFAEIHMRYSFGTPCFKLIRRSLIIERGYKFETLIASNDVMFSIYTGYAAKEITVSSEIIYCITKSEGTLPTTENEVIFHARFNVLLRWFIFLKKRLSKNELRSLKCSLGGRTFQAFSLFGLKKALSVLYLGMKAGIPPISKQVFNIKGVKNSIEKTKEKKYRLNKEINNGGN